MSRLLPLLILILLSGCASFQTLTRSTPAPIEDAFACVIDGMQRLGYEIQLSDSVGGVVQGRRQIRGITESARRGAAAATDVLTGGIAARSRVRFDQLTVLVYSRPYPDENAIDVTAGLLTVMDGEYEQSPPGREGRSDALRLVEHCGG